MTGTPIEARLRDVLTRARVLDRDLTGLMTDVTAAEPLRDSVLRPLTEALVTVGGNAETGSDEPAETGDPADRVWDLAKDVTRLRVEPDLPLGVHEAAAALQHLAWLFTEDDDARTARVAELAEIQAGLPPRIQVAPNGPYLVTNASRVTDRLGETIHVLPQTALCRCGESDTKPLCDGSHARIGFSGAKEDGRVPDDRQEYPGNPVTVTDNRGLCAHSGLCTDRLSSVFRQKEEPFVAPSGGRMDEIVRTVRACPSGALGHLLDGQQPPPQQREPAIEVSLDGPYRITGGIPLVDADGAPEPRDAGASTEHYSLCRCGHSRNKPFCSGMHWYVGFADPPPSAEPTLYEWAGGLPALTRMTHIFYDKYVPQDPLLAPLFARMAPDHPERVAAWLVETFGGPKLYTEQYGGYDHMVAEHAGKALKEEWRARWAQLISRAADDAGLPTDAEFRAAFAGYVEWGSRIAVENSQPGATPPPHMPVPRWWWVCGATPGARVSALAPTPEQPVTELPAENEPIGFAAHIQPLFREMDRKSMSFMFDLWSHDDVTTHAEAILARLRQGTMPCDGAWPAERVDAFARWIAEGNPA
ncbi:CDGSH iron-sulfur domain-containing protein [Embleya sp. NBC_00896]|uniref:CDGSH iron-sulfur domain-containing protein n=1 Tax=Embleya sp. NBC_00896 TaxID=2975961 RepID=UPI00386EF65D|nr:CDGSH iron-sulfur domain-containing protein [Embleya sp. NBC_00896]